VLPGFLLPIGGNKKCDVGLAYSRITHTENFVEMNPLIQKLKSGIYEQYSDLVSILSLIKEVKQARDEYLC
jgi:hypothetical protein